jgi:hypothetical protein
MKKVSRNDFLKMGMLTALSPLVTRAFAGKEENIFQPFDEVTLFQQLVDANDKQVDALIQTIQPGMTNFSRRIASDFSCMAASYVTKDSRFFHKTAVIDRLQILISVLQKNQTTDGTVNISNLESPPDTAFLIELICPGISLLKKDGTKEALDICDQIKPIMLMAGEALATGGVHTANHRWVISAALSQLNHLYPHQKYTDRIADWLDEGIFQDKEGHYAERSMLYSNVENTAYITIARMMNLPDLYIPVRKNLDMLTYYLEPDGKMVTTDSRRQDQYLEEHISLHYFSYRYLAVHDKNAVFAGVVQFIETLPAFKSIILPRGLFKFLETPLLLKNLPAATPVPTHYEKLFTTTSLLRIRRNNTTMTLFGGVDWPIIIASGRSNSPNFFAYRKGKAILKHIRLSSQFFAMGFFYSEGLRKEGNKYILHKKLEIPYYQPIAKNLRNKDGKYAHSPSIDDRFWNLMDFKNRPVSNLKTMETTITLTENNGAVELYFDINGLKDVPVTIELCFDAAGKLSGTTGPVNGNYFLEQGNGEYTNGGDTIQFGPGANAHKNVMNLDGERYSTHFGTLREQQGLNVYITGVTPFSYRMRLW